jgi:hypothetical protein
VAYEIYELQNSHQNIGLEWSVIEAPMDENFLTAVKEKWRQMEFAILLLQENR